MKTAQVGNDNEDFLFLFLRAAGNDFLFLFLFFTPGVVGGSCDITRSGYWHRSVVCADCLELVVTRQSRTGRSLVSRKHLPAEKSAGGCYTTPCK